MIFYGLEKIGITISRDSEQIFIFIIVQNETDREEEEKMEPKIHVDDYISPAFNFSSSNSSQITE